MNCHMPYFPSLKGLLLLVREEEVVHERIFCCVWPSPSHVTANPKSLLTRHAHTFLCSVHFYWAPNMFQALASALETRNWRRQVAYSLEGYVSKWFWWSEWHENIPLNPSVKSNSSLSKCWGNRSLGEFILKYSSPISHIPISTQRAGWLLKLLKALQQTLPHATLAVLFTVAPREMGLPGHSILSSVWWCI